MRMVVNLSSRGPWGDVVTNDVDSSVAAMSPLEAVFGGSFPLIETQRLQLRELRVEDAGALYRMFSDPDLMRYWGQPHSTIADTTAMVDSIISSFRSRSGIEWAVTIKGSDVLIGKVCHHRLLKAHFRSEIGYILAKQHWGLGFATEAVGAIVAFGFDKMGLHSIEAQLDPANVRSANVLEGLGFVKEAHLRENFFVHGAFVDTAIYSLLQSSYRSR